MRPRVPKSKSLARSRTSARQDGSVVTAMYYDEMMAPPTRRLTSCPSCSLVGRSILLWGDQINSKRVTETRFDGVEVGVASSVPHRRTLGGVLRIVICIKLTNPGF